MNSTIFEFLAVTSLVYLGLFVVGAPLSLGLRLRGSLFIILSPIVGAAVTEVFAWYVLDFSDIGLHAALPWLMGGCVLAIAAIWLVGRQKKTLKSHSHIWESDDLRSLALTTALVTTTFSLHARWLLGFSRLTIGVIGNNDVASYATLARHVSMNGFANAGYIAQDHLGSRARADVSGMFSLFSQATWITGRWEWEVAMPVLLVATLLVAQGLCFLLCRTVHLGWISSALLATISVNTFLFAYISWNYFIAQLFAMATLPIFLYLLQRGEADIGRLRALIITAILVIHLLLVYPHMTFLLLPVLVVMSTLNTGSPVGLLSRAGASVRLLSGGLLLGAAVVPTRFLDSIERTILLKDIVAGWPLTEILPWALVGFQTSFRATSTPWGSCCISLAGLGMFERLATPPSEQCRNHFPTRRHRGCSSYYLHCVLLPQRRGLRSMEMDFLFPTATCCLPDCAFSPLHHDKSASSPTQSCQSTPDSCPRCAPCGLVQ